MSLDENDVINVIPHSTMVDGSSRQCRLTSLVSLVDCIETQNLLLKHNNKASICLQRRQYNRNLRNKNYLVVALVGPMLLMSSLLPMCSFMASCSPMVATTSRQKSCFLARNSDYVIWNRLSHVHNKQGRQHPRFTNAKYFGHDATLSNTLSSSSSSSSQPSLSSRFDRIENNPLLFQLTLIIPTADDMEEVGALLSQQTGPGDVVLLDGDLGAGKTGLSRGFVRARTGNLEQRVTSPTFLLSNSYPTPDGIEIRHMDLYRLSGEEKDLRSLDLDFVFQNCISLIEWPSRLGSIMPMHWLKVDIHVATPERMCGDVKLMYNNDDVTDYDCSTDCARCMHLIPHGKLWEDRLRALVDDGTLEDLIIITPDSSTL